jgi:hypothetical protein
MAAMARTGEIGYVRRSMIRTARFQPCVLVLLGLSAAALVAQDAMPVQDDKVATLHVYTNLVQTTVLVLDQARKPIPSIPEGRFFVSLDGGPRFRVTHARLAGDDPISLAVLLDLSQPYPNLMKNIDDAVADLAPHSLNASDHVSIYSLNCQLVLAASPVSAEPAALKSAVDVALQSWTARGRRRQTVCQKPWHLFDSLMLVTQALQKQAGHRVILTVSDGLDRGSINSWNLLRVSAQKGGVAIFGLTELLPQSRENFFNSLCDSTGGMLLLADNKSLAKELEHFTTVLRGRYVVEFPHAIATKAAYHAMDITIDKSDALIRASGIQVPLDDPAILNDPTTVRSDPSHTPQLGNHKILPHN